MRKNTGPPPDWELVLSSAARLQHILPDAVLVGAEPPRQSTPDIASRWTPTMY
jgi:hypothetical protein